MTSDLIPNNTTVQARIMGAERFVFTTLGKPVRYRLFFQVVSGPFAGRQIERILWNTANGAKVMNADMKKLGCTHPEQLCVKLQREYLVEARVTIEMDNYGNESNRVSWFKLLQAEPTTNKPVEATPTTDEPIPTTLSGSVAF
jgi:hypothetical protein